MNAESLLETTARHEAGHAVMRWLLDLPATEVTASETGDGFCAGTGRLVDLRPSERALLCLAGPAAEGWYGALVGCPIVPSECVGEDYEQARAIIAAHPGWWGCEVSADSATATPRAGDAAMVEVYAEACWMLCAEDELVEAIAGELVDRGGRLPARSVAALCRRFGRRKDTEETGR